MKLKLPRQIEMDPRCAAVEAVLAQDVRPLWEKGTVTVPHIAYLPVFESALKLALLARQVERGLERSEIVLNAEKKGLQAVQEKQGIGPANRVSRLLIVPGGGTERFYRDCDRLLFNHADRVLGLRVDIGHEQLGQRLFDEDVLIKALLVADKESVVSVLFALVQL